MLLDTVNSREVSSKAFSIVQDHQWKGIILECLTTQGIFYRQDTQGCQWERLQHGGLLHLEKRMSWVISLGSIRIVLIPVWRDYDVQKLYNINFASNSGNLVKRIENAQELVFPTPSPMLLQGIWGEYTLGRPIRTGGQAIVSGLHNIFSVPYCSSCI